MIKKNPVSVRVGEFEFLKLNAQGQEWRDAYHWVLALSWPRFMALIAAVYLVLNLIFAFLYTIGGNSVAEMPAGSFASAFFFSVETLATVGYGHMYPVTVYGHVVVTIEIIVAMFWFAVITGLIFVRFSRPTARIAFSDCIVIAPFDGKPALMLRVANLRHHCMVEAEFRIMFTQNKAILEDDEFRHFYNLKLEFDHLITFPVALTLRHLIDEQSPLHGQTAESLQASHGRFTASVVCIETVIPATVQSQRDYSWKDVRFGERFVDIYTQPADGKLTVDYGRLHETELVPP